MHSAGSRSLLLTLASAILLMGIFALLPDGLYQRVFCRIPARIAAAYFGAECHGTSFRLRIIVTVYTRLAAEPFLPARFLGAVHLFSGVLVFFPALLVLVKYGKLDGKRET